MYWQGKVKGRDKGRECKRERAKRWKRENEPTFSRSAQTPEAKLAVLLLFFFFLFPLRSLSLSPSLAQGQSRAATGFSPSHGDQRDVAAMATRHRLLERRPTPSRCLSSSIRLLHLLLRIPLFCKSFIHSSFFTPSTCVTLHVLLSSFHRLSNRPWLNLGTSRRQKARRSLQAVPPRAAAERLKRGKTFGSNYPTQLHSQHILHPKANTPAKVGVTELPIRIVIIENLRRRRSSRGEDGPISERIPLTGRRPNWGLKFSFLTTSSCYNKDDAVTSLLSVWCVVHHWPPESDPPHILWKCSGCRVSNLQQFSISSESYVRPPLRSVIHSIQT